MTLVSQRLPLAVQTRKRPLDSPEGIEDARRRGLNAGPKPHATLTLPASARRLRECGNRRRLMRLEADIRLLDKRLAEMVATNAVFRSAL